MDYLHTVNDWLKVIVPILITGVGIITYGLFHDVSRIEKRLLEGDMVLYRIEQLEIDVKELQKVK